DEGVKEFGFNNLVAVGDQGVRVALVPQLLQSGLPMRQLGGPLAFNDLRAGITSDLRGGVPIAGLVMPGNPADEGEDLACLSEGRDGGSQVINVIMDDVANREVG